MMIIIITTMYRGISFSLDKGWCTSRLRITIPYTLWLSVNKFPSNQSHHHHHHHHHPNNTTSALTSSPSRAAVVVASGVRTVDTISKTAVAASVSAATTATASVVHVSQPLAYQGTDTIRHMKGS